jgi:capsular exopolysaccharide synthesis family protein
VDVADHVQTILRSWRRIVAISAILGFLVLVWNMTRPKTYAATGYLMVTSARESVSKAGTGDTDFLVQNYVTLGESVPVVGAAWERSRLKVDYGIAAQRTSVDQVPNTAFLKVRATGPSPTDAVLLARSLCLSLASAVRIEQDKQMFADTAGLQLTVDQLTQELRALPPGSPQSVVLQAGIAQASQAHYARLAEPRNGIDFTSPPTASSNAVAPRPFYAATIAFFVALIVVGEGMVLLRTITDRFSSADESGDITSLAGFPVLARIPEGPEVETIEAFRLLRTHLMVLEGAGKPRTLAVVSANADAGRTFVSVQLAQSAAALDERVVVIDADLRKPAVHERLGVARAPGLSAVLQGADVNTAMRRIESNPFLRILPSGAPVNDPSAVLGARAFRHVLEELKAVRLVVVDTPPGEPYSDAMAVASQCDATIVVIDIKSSKRRAVRTTIESLERGGANIVGVVVNRTAATATRYYGH